MNGWRHTGKMGIPTKNANQAGCPIFKRPTEATARSNR
jgi:hypothetical protein